jgi:hypothetical protein
MAFFNFGTKSAVYYRRKRKHILSSGEIPTHSIMQSKYPIINGRKIFRQHTKLIISIGYLTGKAGIGVMKLTRYEQETVVNYNAGEQNTILYTRDKAVMRKLDTLVADFPDTYKLTEQDKVSKTYSFPKSHISYLKPRAVGTEQRERVRQMMIAKNKAKGD